MWGMRIEANLQGNATVIAKFLLQTHNKKTFEGKSD